MFHLSRNDRYEEVPGGLDDNLERFKKSGALDEWKLQIATVLKDLRDVESNAAQVLTGCVPPGDFICFITHMYNVRQL